MSTIPLPPGASLETSGLRLPPGATLLNSVTQPVTSDASGQRQGLMRGVGDVWDTLKGVGGLFAPPADPTEQKIGLLGPGSLQTWRMGKAYFNAVQAAHERSQALADKGDVKGSMIESGAAGLPLVGPLISGLYDQSGKGDLTGDASMGASRIAQVLSMAPEGSVLPNPVGILAKAPSAANKAIATAGREAVPIAGKAARIVSDVINPEVTGIVSPRMAHIQRVLGKMADAIDAAQAGSKTAQEAASPSAEAYAPIEPKASQPIQATPAKSKFQTFADVREDASIVDAMREDLAKQERAGLGQERREFADRNSMDKPKWLRLAEAKAAQIMAEAEAKAHTPSKYTDTPKLTPMKAQAKYSFLKNKQTAGQHISAADQSFVNDYDMTLKATGNLEQLLEESIRQAKAKRGAK